MAMPAKYNRLNAKPNMERAYIYPQRAYVTWLSEVSYYRNKHT